MDHDVAHLLSLALTQTRGGTLYEFSLYHGHQMPPPFFRCMKLIPAPGELIRDTVSLSDAFRWLLSVRHYRSQRKTFLGLVPFCLKGILFKRELFVRAVTTRDYLAPPHKGPLFYETRFKVPHESFLVETCAFIETLNPENSGISNRTTNSDMTESGTSGIDARAGTKP